MGATVSPACSCVAHTGLVHGAVDRQVLARLEAERNMKQNQEYMSVSTGHSNANVKSRTSDIGDSALRGWVCNGLS